MIIEMKDDDRGGRVYIVSKMPCCGFDKAVTCVSWAGPPGGARTPMERKPMTCCHCHGQFTELELLGYKSGQVVPAHGHFEADNGDPFPRLIGGMGGATPCKNCGKVLNEHESGVCPS